MWTDSKKWQEMRRNGGHGVVRFDVFCGQCNKQIGEDVSADCISKCGLNSDSPMEIFCDSACAKVYEVEKGVTLFNNGWHKIFTP
jgi:hypothetical protein